MLRAARALRGACVACCAPCVLRAMRHASCVMMYNVWC